MLTTGDFIVSGQLVPGEGRRARAVQELLLSGADRDTLARAGVGWVVVESANFATALALPVAYRDANLTVYRVGGDRPDLGDDAQVALEVLSGEARVGLAPVVVGELLGRTDTRSSGVERLDLRLVLARDRLAAEAEQGQRTDPQKLDQAYRLLGYGIAMHATMPSRYGQSFKRSRRHARASYRPDRRLFTSGKGEIP